MTTDLDMRLAAALKVSAGSIGRLGGTVQALNRIHKDINARLASGRVTDAAYANKFRELLCVIRNFDGLFAEA